MRQHFRHMIWTLLFSAVVSIDGTALASSQPAAPGWDWRTRIEPPELVQVLGYWRGQTRSLERIGRDFREHSRRATMLQDECELRFRPAIDAINEYGRSLTPEWDSLVTRALVPADELLDQQELSVADASAFLDEVEARCDGSIVSPIREVMISFHPDYIESPAEEFVDDLVVEYSTDGEPKAHELELILRVPASWSSQSSRRPHIVRTFRDRAGHGGVAMSLLVFDIPPQERREWTREALEFLASEEHVRESAGARFIESGMTRLARQPASWCTYVIQRRASPRTRSNDDPGISHIL